MDGWFIAQVCVLTTLTKLVVIERNTKVQSYIYIGRNLSESIVICWDWLVISYFSDGPVATIYVPYSFNSLHDNTDVVNVIGIYVVKA